MTAIIAILSIMAASTGGFGSRDRRDNPFPVTREEYYKRSLQGRTNSSWAPVLPTPTPVVYGPESDGTIRVSFYNASAPAPQRATYTPDRTVRPSILTSRFGVDLY